MYLCTVTEVHLYFCTMLVAAYRIWCAMGQDTGAGRTASSVWSCPSLLVVRVSRSPSESNGERSRSRPPGAFSIQVTSVCGGKSWEGGTFVQNMDEASGRTQIQSIKWRFVFCGHAPESEALRNEEWDGAERRKWNRGRVWRRAGQKDKAEESGNHIMLCLPLEDQRLKLKIPLYPGYSIWEI